MFRFNHKTLLANLTLVLITIGFFISYPFRSTFLGGLLSSGCSAGMIGGLADWFAITALFRKPLGIRTGKIIRTEIIPHNRERIFAALADMVQEELLTKAALKKKLEVYNIGGQLIHYLSEKGRPELEKIIYEILIKAVSTENLKSLIGFTLQIINENKKTPNPAELLSAIIKFTLENDLAEDVFELLSEDLQKLVHHQLVHHSLQELIEQSYAIYEGKNPARKIVDSFIPSPDVLADSLQIEASSFFKDSSFKDYLIERLEIYSIQLETSASLRETIETFFSESFQIDRIAGFFNSLLREKLSDEMLKEKIAVFLDGFLKKIEENPSWQLKLDNAIKSVILELIETKHYAIGDLVRKNLEPLTDEMLVKLIESRAGQDLQMIRINGSIFGALVGLIIFMLNYLIEQGRWPV